MSERLSRILADLAEVDRVRSMQCQDPALADAVRAVKAFQARRFEATYADLLADARYRAAARFFLDELYGPHEFAQRDAQFARIVPSVVRLFPDHVVDTVVTLAQLHALSETLDLAMARRLGAGVVAPARYVAAWQGCGTPDQRQLQIALTLKIGRALDRHTRSPLLQNTLRLMRSPARRAGLGDLHRFLEGGFDAFREMKGATDFLAIIEAREAALSEALFDKARWSSGVDDRFWRLAQHPMDR